MPKKYSYNGANFSYDQLLEKYGTDANVQKAINQFGFKETEDAGEILPGKPKPVAKEDANATVKGMASKSAKPSSVSQNNVWGVDRSQPDFITNLQKATAPAKKDNKLRSFEERSTGEVAPNSDQYKIPSIIEYKKKSTDETEIPKEFLKKSLEHLKTKDGIKFEIEKNDLDLKDPNLYYSTSKKGDEFVNQNYNSDKLKKLGINPDDFDGFINKKGYKNDFINKDQSGAFQRNWLEKLEDIAPDWMGRSTQSQEEVQFKKEKLLNNYLNLYLKDKDKKANLYKQLKDKELNPNKDWQEINKTNKEVPVIDPNAVSEYNKSMFPTIAKIDADKIVEDKKIVEHLKTRSTPIAALEETWGFGKELVGSMWNSSKELIATGQDLIGLDKEADVIRSQAAYDEYKNPDTRGIGGFIKGKSTIVDGIKYQTDDAGNIYNVTHGFNIAGLVDDNEYKNIKKDIEEKGKEDWYISPRGAAKSTAQVLGAMVPQIVLTEMTMGLGGAIGTRALATRAGFSSVAEYKNMVNLSEAVGGKVLSKMPLPITKDMAGAIVTQSAFGYSNGYEQTLKAARDAGINDKEAEALALTAGNQMALLYGATAPLSPQTKARELLFGSVEKRLLKEALNEYRNNGTKGFINNLTSGVKSAVRGAVGFVEEGGKETAQENIQQIGEQEIVNADVNELAGQKILKDTYTYQDFVNTSGLAFLSGGMIANAKIPNFVQDPNQRLINLVTLGSNPITFQSNLDELVKSGAATEKEAEALKNDAIATVRQIRKIPKDVDAETSLNLVRKLQEVENLEESKKTIAKPFHQKIDEQINGLNTEITDIYDKRLDVEVERLKTLTSQAEPETFAEGAINNGEAYNVIDTKEESAKAAEDWFINNNRQDELYEINDNGDKVKIDFESQPAIVLPNGQIIINREIARVVDEGASAGRHELLHKILKSQFNDSVKADELLNKFKGVLSAQENSVVEQRLKDRGYTKEYLSKNQDEYLTQFFEALENKEITATDATFKSMWKSIFRPIYKALGFEKLDFENGNDIYQFLKDYHKTSKAGKLTSRQKTLLEAGKNVVGTTASSKTASELVKEKIADLEENEGDYDPDEYDQEVARLEGELKRAIAKEKAEVKPVIKKEVSEEDTVKEIINNEKGTLSSDKVQQIYDEKGLNGAAEIIKLFKPITNKIVDKRRDAPGFDRELLTDEIETGSGGILDLIKSYNASKGVPLAAYINKQLPLRAIASSKRVLDESFSKDVTEEKGLMASETASEVKEKPKYKNVLESKVFSPEVLESANKKIISVIRTLKSRIDAPVSLNKTVTPLISEIRDQIGKQLDIDVKTAMGGKKDNQLQNWLLDNKQYVLENMTTTWLMGKDGQGGMPIAIQKQIDGKWVNYPEWVGKKIDREKTTTDNAGRTSGAELVRRLPNVNNNISDSQFLDQVIGPDGNPIRGRKESLAKAVAEEMAFDIINNDLENQGPIYEALATNQTRLGVEIMDNLPVVFKKDSDRGNIKYSKTLNNLPIESQEYFFADENYNQVINELTNINAGNFPPKKQYIQNVLKNVYDTKKISVQDLDDIAEDFSIYLEKFKSLPLRTLESKEEKQFLSEYIKKSAEIGGNDLSGSIENIQKIGAEGRAVTEMFKNEADLKAMYNALNGFVSNIKNDPRSLEWYRMLGNFLASQAQIGDDTFTTKDGLLVKTKDKNFTMDLRPGGPRKKVNKKTGEETKKEFSYQPFSDKDSFWKFISDSIGKEKLPAGYNKNLKTNEKDSASELFEKQGDSAYLDNKKATTIANREFLYNLLEYIYNPSNEVSDGTKAMIWASLNSSVESPLRKSGMAKWMFDGVLDNKNKKLVYEHLTSVNKKKLQLHNLFSSGINNKKEAFDKLMEDYNVAVIPKVMDDEITALGFKVEPLIGDITEGARYYNILTSGVDNLFSLKALDKNAKQKTLGKEFVEFIKKTDYKNAQRLAAVTYSLKASKTKKGISVFDFDDTVGLTKSNVLYTMPDGTKGKLNAEEFAKDGSKLLNEGAIFDFSEFSKVTNGKPGPMVEKMKKMIAKFGPDNFFILTARPADSAGPIHQFLSSIGIDIPLENITGLGNSTAQAKADWMTAKAAEGYNDFYFADDAIQNVEAVKKALQIPGVNSKIQQARAKFSLTSKQDLKWKQGDEDLSTKFTVGNIDYRISMIETAYMEYDDDVQKTLFDLVEENDLDEETTIAAYDGEAYNLEFWDKKKGNGITGVGNAAEVFGIVINGVAERVKKKNIESLVFTAKEPSRIKLYNSMAEVVANKLGWGAYYKDGVYILTKKPKTIGATTGVGSLKPVKDVLNVVDINSPINQSKAKFSKTISPEFNKIIEENTGMENYKVFSDIVARRRGAKKNRFDFYVPPSAADFELLLYNFIGKGKRGEEQQKFFADALLKPYANGNDLMDAARQSIKKDYKALTDQFPDIKNKIEKLTPDGDFTYDQAIRVAMWTEEGVEIPGISQRDQKKLTDLVNNDPELAAFKQGLIITGRQGKGWVTPTEFWDASTIISDLHNLTEGEGRKKFLAEFIDNAQEMFGKWENGKLVGPNINKVEAVYGTNVREAIEDVLYRMTTGKNRSQGKDKETSMWANWVTGSTGAIMFLNVRSAALQLIGATNFLNLRDNNPIAAAAAFANQKQYWEDFAHIWNSDKMKERRGGLKEDVAAAEIANAAAGSKNKVGAVLSYLLKIGYTPTQMADSFAIASGGAPFYRNRIKSYLKEGQSQTEAEANAWNDFTKVSDETQQSGDPRDISKQQASAAGRLLLTFQNTAMQQSRIVKKAVLDLKNRRGDDKTNVAKIAYYLAIQNTMFAVLQQGLFAVAFGYDDEDKEKPEKEKKLNEKLVDVADGVVDTILRGTGFTGGIIATLKNMAKKYLEEKDKEFKADYAKVMLEGANISPTIGSKLRKLYSGLQQTKFERDLIKERGWGVMQDGRVHLGPMYGVSGKLVESFTNVPMDRLVTKIENASQAMNSQNKAWQRVMVGLGWSPYSIGIEESAGDQAIRAKAKEIRAEEGKIKAEETRERTKDSISQLPASERMRLKREDRIKARENELKRRERKANRKMG